MPTTYRIVKTLVVSITLMAPFESILGMVGCSSPSEERKADVAIDKKELSKQYRKQSEGLLKIKPPVTTPEPKRDGLSH